MTDSLRAKLVNVLDGIVDLFLSEAEVKVYPYAVYDMTTDPVMDKDGIHHFVGDTKIRLVGDDNDVVEALRPQVDNAILTGMHNATFSARHVDTTKECVDGIWTIEMNYTLKQYADWVLPPDPPETTSQN